MSNLSQRVGKEFTLTTELRPPRGPDLAEFLGYVDTIKDLRKVAAVNVIDSPSARLYMSSLGASLVLKQNGIEPIFQMVCRDRNSLALESDLISAAAFGIENILALTGDHPQRGASDHPTVKPVFELDATSLIKTITLMNAGTNLSNVPLNGKTNFFVGAAISPSATPAEPEILKIKRKIDAGAKFFQTQAVFDVESAESFFEKVDREVGDIRKNVIVGVIPLASEKMISFLNRLPGLKVPENVSKRVLSAKDQKAEGIDVAVQLIDGIKSIGLGGAHIMPVGRIDSLKGILSKV